MTLEEKILSVAPSLRGPGSAETEAATERRLQRELLDAPRPAVKTAVDVDLTAFHTDPHGDEGRHQHTWNVQLVFNGEPFKDARLLRKALEVFLDHYQGADLPCWSGEDLARRVLTLGTADPIGCIVTRPGYRAEVWL